MNLDSLPVWFVFGSMIVIVLVTIELGRLLGNTARRRWKNEKEAPASSVTGPVIGFAAFMLAFTFSIVWDRYDSRKGLVREDAIAIRTAWERSDFLPEADRAEALSLFSEYVEARVAFAEAGRRDPERVKTVLADTKRVQARLWDMAVVNARKDMNSDVAALYLESLNAMNAVHLKRVALGIQARVPFEIWLVLFSITILGMMGLGYQAGIAESRRSITWAIIALAFGLGFTVIFALDHPDSGYLKVSQQPLLELRDSIRTKL